MMKRIWVVALLVLGGLVVPAVHAQEQKSQPYVVLVGIDKYQDKQIKPRLHAEADAKGLYELFAAKDQLGIDKDHIKLLLGAAAADAKYPAEQATKANIEKALHWLEKSGGKDDLVIFAFFGEGAPLGERACYFAVDSTFKNRAKDAIDSSDIEHIVDKLKSQRFVAMIDVNYLGFDIGKEKAPEPNQSKFYREFLSQGDEDKDPVPSRVLFMANPGLKPSLDLDKHGIFAQVLIDGLSGKADTEGYEADGNISVGELAKYLRKKLPELAREKGTTKEQKEQKPIILEAQNSDFIVAYSPQVHAQAVARIAKFDAIAKDKDLEKTVAEEGHRLLERMPKLEAQRELRKVYQKLADGKIELDGFNTARKEILDGTVISEREAGNYALVVMKAVDLVRKSYVKETTKGTLVENAIRGIYRNIEEEVPPGIKERLEKVKDMKEAELLRLLSEVRQKLGKREDLAKGHDITFSLRYMLSKLDKHTDYIPPEVVATFRSQTQGTFSGIGVQIRRNEARDFLQVVTPIFNSPAAKAGMQAEDIITTIIAEYDPKTGKKYEKPEITSTKGMTTEEAVKKILGKPGTEVKLLVEREGAEKPLEFKLIRGKIEVESVLGVKRGDDASWTYVIDPENRICYVRLTQFSSNSYRDLEKVMKDLSRQGGIKGFILDLRFNPGGLLDSSIKISDLFIDDGMIVSIRHRDGTETSYVGRSDGSYTTFPMVCLINGGSASASEIVSACLQDHGRAIIMGSRSYGKGSVQTINDFVNDSALKLTTATFWRPSGRNLNRASTKGRDEDEWGVTPNAGFILKLSKKDENDLQDAQRDAEIIRKGAKSEKKSDFRDRQLDMAVDYLRNQIRTSAAAARKDADGDAGNR
jgi:C-terminal peptidase prc